VGKKEEGKTKGDLRKTKEMASATKETSVGEKSGGGHAADRFQLTQKGGSKKKN